MSATIQIVLKILSKFVCIWPFGSSCYKDDGQTCSSCHSRDITCTRENDVTTLSGDRKNAPVETQQLLLNNRDAFGENTHVDNSQCVHDHESFESQYTSVHAQLDDVRPSLHDLVQNLTQKDKENASTKRIAMEWQEVGRVLDRTFFCVYIIIIIISLLTLFPRPPHMTFFWERSATSDDVWHSSGQTLNDMFKPVSY